LLPLRRDLNVRRIASTEQEIKQWRESVNQRRQQEAERQAKQASREARRALPAVRQLVEKNAKLAEKRKLLAQSIIETTRELEQTNQELNTLEEQFKLTEEKVEMVGLNNTIGLLLRSRRKDLSNLRVYRRNTNARQETIDEGQLELLELENRCSALANLDQNVQAVLQGLRTDRREVDPNELEREVRGALDTEKTYLVSLISDQKKYFEKLNDLDTAEGQLIEVREEFAKYIDKLVLWISSTQPLSTADVRHAGEAIWWLAGPKAWGDMGRTLVANAAENPVFTVLVFGVILLLIYGRLRFRARIQAIGEKASRGSCYRFFPTVEVFVLTLLVAAAWPGLLWYVGWQLTSAAGASELCNAVGMGMIAAASVYLVQELLRHTCCNQGLGEAHFGWPGSAIRLVRQNLRWLIVPSLPLVCITVALSVQKDEWNNSLGRMCFVAALLCLALFVQRILRPSGGVFQAMIVRRHGGWLDRFRYIWYPLCVMTPAALAVLAATGYYYTAQELATRLIITAYLLVGIVSIRATLLRWILVNKRKLAIEQARQRRTAAQQETGGGSDEAPTTADLPIASMPELDLATIDTQTRRLVECSLFVAAALALWFAWVDVLPALGIFNEIPVWHTPVSVADLGLAVIILATSIIAAKNIPGLLEMAVLQHLPVDAGVRYAVATVSRYVITIVGLMLCFTTIGVGWSKVQWLVSRIRMRATTITDWDRKELIIPNKEFITGRVLNWTLSDPINRVIVNIGIAYGSDTELAAKTLMGVAQNHPLVLDDPAPRVTLESFGDSSLNFVLRCFLPNLENRLTVIHELHMATDRVFREAGIEIAFPQHDLHVRSIDFPFSQLPSGDTKTSVPWPSVAPSAEKVA